MSATENRRINILINGKAVSNDIKSITREFHKQRIELAGTQRDTKLYRQRLAEIRKTKGILTEHSRNIRGLSGAWGRVKETMVGFLGANLIQTGLRALGGLVATMTRKTKEFETAQSELAAVLGVTRKETKALTNDALKYGASTKFTAEEVSKLQTEYARLGFSQQEIQNTTAATLALAAATGSDLAEAAEVAGSTVRSFGLDTEETGKVTDIMAKSFSSSALNLERWKEGMKTAAPIAKAAGIPIEQTAAIMGKLADAGIHGSLAGTALKKIFNELSKDGKPFAESLEDVRLKLSEASSESEKLAIAEDLVGERGQAALLIIADQTEGIEDLTKVLGNASGAAQQMADTAIDNLAGKTTIMKSAWDGFILGLDQGDGAMSRVIGHGVSLATGLLNAATNTRKLSEEMADEQVQLNLLVGELTSVNVSEGRRLEIITELNRDYPSFVNNIDLETASNEDLAGALKQINEEYIQKIILQSQQEELESKAKRLAEATSNVVKAEVKIRKELTKELIAQGREQELLGLNTEEMIQLAKETGGTYSGISDALHPWKDFSNQLQIAKRDLEQVQETNQQVQNALIGSQPIGPQPIADDGSGTSPSVSAISDGDAPATPGTIITPAAVDTQVDEFQRLTEELNAIREEYALQQLDKDAQELQRIQMKYDAMIAQAGENDALVAQITAQRDLELSDARLRHQEEYQLKYVELKKELEQYDLDEKERDLLLEAEKWDEKIVLAKEAGLDVVALEKMKFDAMDALSEEYHRKDNARALKSAQDQMAVLSAFGSVYINTLELMGGESEKNAEFQKGIALSQLAIDTALAISGAVSSAQSLPYPGNLVAVASGIATVLANIATAKQYLSTSDAPSYGDGGSFLNDPLKGPSHDENGGMPVLDPRTGDVRAFLEGDEFIVRKSSVNASTLPLLRRINQQGAGAINYPSFAAGGQFDLSNSGQTESNDLIATLISEVRHWESRLEVQLPLKNLEDKQDDLASLRKIVDLK